MKGHGAKFGRKKELAIAALLTNRSVEDAARAVDLNHNTLLKAQNPGFREGISRGSPGSRESICCQAAAVYGSSRHGNALS